MKPLVKVTSPSFSKNPVLAAEMAALPVRPVLNTSGKRYKAKALIDYLADADAAIVDPLHAKSLERASEHVTAEPSPASHVAALRLSEPQSRSVLASWGRLS